MRICRYDENRLGVVREHRVYDVSAVLDELPQFRYPLPDYDPFIAALPRLQPLIEASLVGAQSKRLDEIRLLPPVASPRKIVAAPVNYQAHLNEADHDVALHQNAEVHPIHRVGLFLKATSSLIGPSQPIVIRHPERRNDHEIELVAVIGRKADRVSREAALEHVAGYCIGLDMTVRGTEERSMRKSIDTYSVLGPWMVTADELPDTSALEIELRVNGEVRQNANTRSLILDLPALIERASSFYTLMPGDLVFTGTPEGVSEVKAGDVIDVSIQALGSMRVAVA